MSSVPPKSASARLVQAAALVIVFGLLFLATRLAPESRVIVGTIAGLGFLLLAGTLTSELVETLGLPHLTGYILAGIVAGPHVLDLVDVGSVHRLSDVNGLALALIALAGGAELRLAQLRAAARSLAWAMLFQTVLVMLAAGLTLVLLARFIPFTRDLPPSQVLAVGLLWGVMAVGRSPAAVLALLTQLRPKGPVTTFTLGFVMSSNLVVVVMTALVISVARPLVDPGVSLDLGQLQSLGREVLGSASLGTMLGIVLALYLRFVKGSLLLVLVALGFGLTELLRYAYLDPLLAFMVAGFVVQNFSAHGDLLRNAVEKTGAIVFVVFFATAGAELDLPLLVSIWPVALTLTLVRGIATWGAARAASALAGDPPIVKKWGWSGLVSQAGLTLGLSVVVARAFPEFGEGFRTLAIGVVGINEIVGPVLAKLGLDRSGETGEGRADGPPSIAPTA